MAKLDPVLVIDAQGIVYSHICSARLFVKGASPRRPRSAFSLGPDPNLRLGPIVIIAVARKIFQRKSTDSILSAQYNQTLGAKRGPLDLKLPGQPLILLITSKKQRFDTTRYLALASD